MTYNGEPKVMGFKQLVTFISKINNESELNEAYVLTELSFQHEKIHWVEHEIIHDLLLRINCDLGLH